MKLWLPALIITIVLFFINKSAWEEVEAYSDYYGGWEGFAEGFISGYIGDTGKVGRVEDRYISLIENAEFWRTLFFLSLLATTGLGVFSYVKSGKRQA